MEMRNGQHAAQVGAFASFSARSAGNCTQVALERTPGTRACYEAALHSGAVESFSAVVSPD